MCIDQELQVINKAQILKDAQKFITKGQLDKAIAEYNKLIKDAPNDSNIHNTIGDLYLKRNEKENAIESYKKAAELLNKSGFTLKAIALYKKVMNILPDQVDILLTLGKLNAERGMLGNANESYLAAANYYTKQGKKDRALDIYKTLCNLNPDNSNLAQKLAELYLSEGMHAEGVSKLIELAEKKANEGAYGDARDFLEKASAKGSDRFDFKVLSARLDLKEGRLAEALKELEEARSLDPNDDRVAELLGESYLRAGRYEECDALFRGLLDKNPDNQEYKEYLVELASKTGAVSAPGASAKSPFTDELQVPPTEGLGEQPEGFLGDAPVEDFKSPFADELQVPPTEVSGEQPQENVYELPESPEELPPLDLGGEDELDMGAAVPEPAGGAYELPDISAGGIEGLDIFDTEKPPEELFDVEKEPSEQDSQTGMAVPSGVGMPTEEAGEPEGAESLEERLTEIDIYIKYGLSSKAMESLIQLEEAHADDPEVVKRRMDICKADGDLDGFVASSLKLADIYEGQDMAVEADDVIQKALRLDPENSLLKGRVEAKAPAAPEAPPEMLEEMFGEEPAAAPEMGSGTDTAFDIAHPSVQYMEELAEADFYAQQGLIEEARNIYRRILASDPENEEVRTRYSLLNEAPEKFNMPEETPPPQAREEAPASVVHGLDDELDAAFKEMDFSEGPAEEAPAPAHVAEAPKETPQTPARTSEVTSDEPDGFFDLAAELRDEMEAEIVDVARPSDVFEDAQMDEVFQEFKKGVEEQLGSEDYETHYNLGIAYKEMGMLDEAVSEFTLASKDIARTLDCASMLGLCYLETGDYGKALDFFKKGLAVKGRDKEEYLGLKYDMATAYELSGDVSSAQALVGEIKAADEEFRDVKKRLQRLNKSLMDAGLQPVKEKPSTPEPKKSKVSYL